MQVWLLIFKASLILNQDDNLWKIILSFSAFLIGLMKSGKSKPKTEVIAPIVSNKLVPISRATTSRIGVPRTATQRSNIKIYLRIVLIPCTSFPWSILIVFMPTVFAPFPNISVHIIQSKVIRQKLIYRSCLLTVFSFRCVSEGIIAIIIHRIGCNRLPKIKRGFRSCSTSVFPLGFCNRSGGQNLII
jgi:hypothetical protein